ncbi:MAG: hypothetical protein FWE40_02445 [Oscillospiraceae bacterium]|nr:hypothetical protein [Oscillospiraceae bacterium]
MTTNTTWTTVNGVVLPGSGTRTFNNPCNPCATPFGMSAIAPGFGNCGFFGMPGLPGCFSNMQSMPCCCTQRFT